MVHIPKERTGENQEPRLPNGSLVTTSVGIATSGAGFATLCEKCRIDKVRVSLRSLRWRRWRLPGLYYVKPDLFNCFKMCQTDLRPSPSVKA